MSDDSGALKMVGTDGGLIRFGPDNLLRLDSGAALHGLEIAYRTYGRLNRDKSNAVLVCHALTLDQHLASAHPLTGKPGWWDRMVGPRAAAGSRHRHFIICSNVVGGCMGSSGPSSIRSRRTGQVYGLSFPIITIADMVRAQRMLIDALGIETLFSVIGGSMGGMQVLQWAADYPDRLFSAACIAARARAIRPRTSPSTRSAARRSCQPTSTGAAKATMPPRACARKRAWRWRGMAAHITYLSENRAAAEVRPRIAA